MFFGCKRKSYVMSVILWSYHNHFVLTPVNTIKRNGNMSGVAEMFDKNSL